MGESNSRRKEIVLDANLVVQNANILTVDSRDSVAQALAVESERFLFVIASS
jgi:predicted amidohydrolase YtcJ